MVMHDGTVRVVEALTFRVEHGALVLVQPAGLVSAFAPGIWRQVEPEAAP